MAAFEDLTPGWEKGYTNDGNAYENYLEYQKYGMIHTGSMICNGYTVYYEVHATSQQLYEGDSHLYGHLGTFYYEYVYYCDIDKNTRYEGGSVGEWPPDLSHLPPYVGEPADLCFTSLPAIDFSKKTITNSEVFYPNEVVNYSFSIANTGEQSAENFSISILIDDKEYDTKPVVALLSGETKQYDLQIDLSKLLEGLSSEEIDEYAGNHTITIKLDSQDTVTELNETNNAASVDFRVISDAITDQVLERFARNSNVDGNYVYPYVVYNTEVIKAAQKNKTVIECEGLYFIVDTVFDDNLSSGFFAMGLLQCDKDGNNVDAYDNAILVCQGTQGDTITTIKFGEGLIDIFADTHPLGVGYGQSQTKAFADAVDWVKYQQNQLKNNAYVTGQSLGGAVAQMIASEAGDIYKLVTFNSPGINAAEFNDISAQNVVHYVNSGDMVSMAGKRYIKSKNGENKVNIIQSEFILGNDQNKGEYQTSESNWEWLLSMHDRTFLSLNNSAMDYIENDVGRSIIYTTNNTDFLEAEQFSYLHLPFNNDTITSKSPGVIVTNADGEDFFFNSDYARFALRLALGNVTIANQFLTRKRAELCRELIGVLVKISEVEERLPGVIKTASIFKDIFNLLGINFSSLSNFEIDNDIYKKVLNNTNITIGNQSLFSSSNQENKDYRIVDLDSDNAPDLIYNITDQKFEALEYVDTELIFQTSGDSESKSAYAIKIFIDKAFGWLAMKIPTELFNNSYSIDSACTGNDDLRNNIFQDDYYTYLLDDPETEYVINFSRNENVIAEKGAIALAEKVITVDTELFTIYATDIDMNKNSGGGNDTIILQINAENQQRSITLHETVAEGIFSGKLALNQSDSLFVRPGDTITFSYRDSNNGEGASELISQQVSVYHSEELILLSEATSVQYTGEFSAPDWTNFSIAIEKDINIAQDTYLLVDGLNYIKNSFSFFDMNAAEPDEFTINIGDEHLSSIGYLKLIWKNSDVYLSVTQESSPAHQMTAHSIASVLENPDNSLSVYLAKDDLHSNTHVEYSINYGDVNFSNRNNGDVEWFDFNDSITVKDNTQVYVREINSETNKIESIYGFVANSNFNEDLLNRVIAFNSQGSVVSRSLMLTSRNISSDGLASVVINSGGVAQYNNINLGGTVVVSSGALLTHTTVNNLISANRYLGGIRIDQGGLAEDVIISSGGYVETLSGGRIEDSQIQAGGIMIVSAGTILAGEQNIEGQLKVAGAVETDELKINLDLTQKDSSSLVYLIDGINYIGDADFSISISQTQSMGKYILASGSSNFDKTITITQNGIVIGNLETGKSFSANGVSYSLENNNNNLSLNISPIDMPVKLYSGEILTSSAHTMSGIALQKNNTMHVCSGGEALDTRISLGGYQYISSGGIVSNTIIENVVSENRFYGGQYVKSAGIASNTQVMSGGYLRVDPFGSALSTTVNSGAHLYIQSAGVAKQTNIDGGFLIASAGAILQGANLSCTGIIKLEGGAILEGEYLLTGQMQAEGIVNGKEANITLDLLEKNVDDLKFYIVNLNNITDASFSIQVPDVMNLGCYTLASNASSFSECITIKNNAGKHLGTLSCGQKIASGDYIYSLETDNDGTLALLVDTNDTEAPTVPNTLLNSINGDTVICTWQNSSDNIGVTGYQIRYGTNQNLQTAPIKNIVNTNCTFNGLENGIYYWQVRSYDNAGNYSEWSNVNSFTINVVSEKLVNIYYDGELTSAAAEINSAVISRNVEMHVSNGGRASASVIKLGGIQYVSSGGVAVDTVVDDVISGNYYVGGQYVTNGGSAIRTTLNSGGFMKVLQGGTADSTLIKRGGYQVIASGGRASNVTIDKGGEQVVSSGAVVNSVYINKGDNNDNGVQYLKGGGVVSNMFLEGGGQETLYGATVYGGYIKSNGIQFVLGKTYDMQIHSGEQWITDTGIADKTTVYAGGEQSLISSGAKATNTTLKQGGIISIAAGASATGIIQEAGGIVARVQAHNAYVTGSNISGSFSCCNGVASNFILHDYIYLESGGSALDTTVSSGGFLWLRSEGNGGYASNVNIHSGGSMRVSSGTIAGTINLHRGGILVIDSCKSAANASVNLILGNSVNELEMIYKSVYTSFSLNSVKDFFVTVSSTQTCGTYKLASGASDFGKTITVRSENKEIGTLAVGSNFTYNGLYYSLSVDSGMLNLNISNNKPAATNVTLFSSGTLVRKDEKIESAMLISGSCNSMFVSSGGTVEYTTIGNGGVLHIFSDGNAQNTIIQSGGELNVSFGGNAQFVEMNAGRVSVQNGGTVDGLTLKSGTLNISSGAQVNNMQISAGLLYNSGIISGLNLYGDISINDGYIENLTVQSGGFAYFYGDYQTGINNATVKNLVIEKAGDVHLAKGVTLEGNVKIYGDLVVYDSINAANAEIDLFINPTDSNFSATISKLEKINGGKISVTVASDMETGIYSIATGINAFDGMISVKNDSGKIIGNYSLQNGEATFRNGTQNLTFRPSFSTTEGVASSLWLMVTYSEIAIDNIIVNSNRVSWEADTNGFVAELSTDNFSNVFSVKTEGCTISTYGMSTGNYQWRVQPDGSSEWTASESFAAAGNTQPQKFVASADDSTDVFFANANGKWTTDYAAQHTGILNGWSGTNEQVTLTGKNKLADIFEGSSDANILLMTDDANGDALFVDDIYTALPGTVAEQQARIAKIDEIRAGAGDDIVDMTSQRFAYIGDGVKIYGGLGNDTIWANNGKNTLFGDAGNDRLVGGANNDVIVGGIGNDRMHGGGGDDIFCFGENWGKDTVEQLVGGEITLWFESGSENNWNADTLTYTDGTNGVKVSGISADNISLKFGDDNSLFYDELANSGCFDDAASEKIFEDKNKGMLA